MNTTYRLDAAALTNSACELKFNRIVIDGYSEPIDYNDTLYGTAFHRFLAVMAESGGNFQHAVLAAQQKFGVPCKIRPKKEHLNEKHLIKTCFDYTEWASNEETNLESVIDENATCYKCNGNAITMDEVGNEHHCEVCAGNSIRPQPLVEIKFDIPFYHGKDYQINLAGTIDRLVKIKNGCYCVRDYKTTSFWDANKFLHNYRLSTQLKFYVWIIKYMASLYPDGSFGFLRDQMIGAAVDGIFLKSKTETTFKSSEVFFYKDDEMLTFREMLNFKVHQLSALIEGVTAQPTGQILGLCGGILPCKFFDVCGAVDKVASAYVLKNNFRQKPYNPLTFGESD